ncbi:unnamed protein product [Rotaria magnacalcarata]|uniref:BZIP domain-containing protein n=1 Tax=Rotaria magnacalcarata TaxID=392030 RepID=A0A819Q128_9BILA|nr:unnamed protein product [Rotaria magnacalcarata]CAF4023850.1 unnamed protein product [Rotaria magnacalcarata]
MHATASPIRHSTGYPSFLSYAHNYNHFNVSMNTNPLRISPNSSHLLSCNSYNGDLNLTSHSNSIKQFQSDDEDDRQSISPSDDNIVNTTLIPFKKRSRTVPPEDKDTTYYEKRSRNNDSAKRSRDARRIKEQLIQERVNFLQHENFRLSMENQSIRYQLSQLNMLSERSAKR